MCLFQESAIQSMTPLIHYWIHFSRIDRSAVFRTTGSSQVMSEWDPLSGRSCQLSSWQSVRSQQCKRSWGNCSPGVKITLLFTISVKLMGCRPEALIWFHLPEEYQPLLVDVQWHLEGLSMIWNPVFILAIPNCAWLVSYYLIINVMFVVFMAKMAGGTSCSRGTWVAKWGIYGKPGF